MELLHHHAYLIQGRIGEADPLEFLKTSGLELPPETEIVRHIYDTLAIDDARELFKLQLRKTGEGAVSLFLIEASFMTREAQNALLKMLEEPSARTHFVLVTPHPELLLLTLRSRFVIIDTRNHPDIHSQAKKFLKGSYQERATIATVLLEDVDRSAIENLLREAVTLLHQERAAPHLLKSFEQLRRYVTDPSSSPKMILEYFVYALPQ